MFEHAFPCRRRSTSSSTPTPWRHSDHAARSHLDEPAHRDADILMMSDLSVYSCSDMFGTPHAAMLLDPNTSPTRRTTWLRRSHRLDCSGHVYIIINNNSSTQTKVSVTQLPLV